VSEATATDEPEATEEPEPTDEPEPAFEIADELYTHSSGAFSLYPPLDWDVDEQPHSASFTAPDADAFVDLAFTNGGTPFDDDMLATFVEAVEENWFATFEAYAADDPEVLEDGRVLVFKTLVFEGLEYAIDSYYWFDGPVVYQQDFWVDSELYEAYAPGFEEVAFLMDTNAAAGAAAVPYANTYTFAGPDDLFEFQVPYGWYYANSAGDAAVVDRFTAPDGGSYIENVTYDDGSTVSKSQSGAFALALLKQYYEVSDIRITGDQVQPDGSERLTWYSNAQEIEGESFFETRGTTFLLLTWIADFDSVDIYRPVWATLVQSYTVPGPPTEGVRPN
jgi:hypothetical protein